MHDERCSSFLDQEKIETEIEEWHEADRDPKDGQLSQHEFLAFRHPEHSEVMLNEMVKDILRSLGKLLRILLGAWDRGKYASPLPRPLKVLSFFRY